MKKDIEKSTKQSPTSFSLSAELKHRLKMATARLNVGQTRFVEIALDNWIQKVESGALASIDRPPENPSAPPLPSAAEETPQKDSVTSGLENALNLLRHHWHDPAFRECLLAIGVIWDVGDTEIMDSLLRNCRTFRRASELVAALERGIRASGDQAVPAADYKQRVERLLEFAKRFEPEDFENEGAPGGPPTGGEGNAPVGGRSVSKTGKQQKGR